MGIYEKQTSFSPEGFHYVLIKFLTFVLSPDDTKC